MLAGTDRDALGGTGELLGSEVHEAVRAPVMPAKQDRAFAPCGAPGAGDGGVVEPNSQATVELLCEAVRSLREVPGAEPVSLEAELHLEGSTL